MDVRIVAALRREYVVVRHGVRGVLADVHSLAVDPGYGSSVDEAVDERIVRVLVDLLDISGYLCRLCPVVILHCDHKDVLDLAAVLVALIVIALLSDGTGRCKRSNDSEPCERAKSSDIQHVQVPRRLGKLRVAGWDSTAGLLAAVQPSTLRIDSPIRQLLRSDDGEVKDKKQTLWHQSVAVKAHRARQPAALTLLPRSVRELRRC